MDLAVGGGGGNVLVFIWIEERVESSPPHPIGHGLIAASVWKGAVCNAASVLIPKTNAKGYK